MSRLCFAPAPRSRRDFPQLDSQFSGVWMKSEPAKTLEAAMRLQPDTQGVVAVGGAVAFDRHVEEDCQAGPAK